jgi:hypothetical protein
MTLHLERLRRAEWLVGIGAIVLLLSLFLLDWYGAGISFGRLSIGVSVDGWHGHTILRWFMLVTIALALATWLASALADTDALPLTLCVVLFDVAFVTAIALAWRVVVNEPGPNDLVSVKAGAWVGLAACVAVAVGAYLMMRDEDRRGAELVVPPTRLKAPGREPAAPPSA